MVIKICFIKRKEVRIKERFYRIVNFFLSWVFIKKNRNPKRTNEIGDLPTKMSSKRLKSLCLKITELKTNRNIN